MRCVRGTGRDHGPGGFPVSAYGLCRACGLATVAHPERDAYCANCREAAVSARKPQAVDVLAVMDRANNILVAHVPHDKRKVALRDARDAVAELVEAARRITEAHAHSSECNLATVRGRLEFSRRMRGLEAALARIGGAK